MINIQAIQHNPNLGQLLELVQRSMALDLSCHHVGTIQEFDPETQLASVTINYKQPQQQVSDSGVISVIAIDYPLLVSCPVVFLGGGQAALTFPVQAGDECLILFNDRDFQVWLSGDSNNMPSTGRLHSLSDAICLVGVRSSPNVIPSFDTDGVVLRFGENVKIKVSADAVTLTNGSSTLTLAGDTLTVQGVGMTFTLSGGALAANNGVDFVGAILDLFNDIATGTVPTMMGPQMLVMPSFSSHYGDLSSFEG